MLDYEQDVKDRDAIRRAIVVQNISDQLKIIRIELVYCVGELCNIGDYQNANEMKSVLAILDRYSSKHQED